MKVLLNRRFRTLKITTVLFATGMLTAGIYIAVGKYLGKPEKKPVLPLGKVSVCGPVKMDSIKKNTSVK